MKKIFFWSMYFCFRHYLSLEMGMAVHLNKPEFYSSKDALCHCPSLIKIGPVVI